MVAQQSVARPEKPQRYPTLNRPGIWRKSKIRCLMQQVRRHHEPLIYLSAENNMKHALLTGLLLTAFALPFTATANDDNSLCQINLSKIRDTKAAKPNLSDAVRSDVDTTVHRAESALARHNDDGARECVSLTQQALQKLQSN
jgi:hypothetical protein